MTIEEGNKIIAEFMGIPKCDRCGGDDCGKYKFGPGIYYYPKEMNYSTSFDWLMPVVHKIGSLPHDQTKTYFTRINEPTIFSPIEDWYRYVLEEIEHLAESEKPATPSKK